MNLKKLKRLLSLTLTAAMVASMISVPVNAETVTDNAAAAMEEMIADPDGEDVADDAESTDPADEVKDEADETENSDVADETEDEGTADASAEELYSADDASGGDGTTPSTGDNTGDGTTANPEAAAIVVGDDAAAGQVATLEEAITNAIAGTVKKIELSKNAELTQTHDFTNTGVEIDTKGHSIIIPATAEITLTAAKITNSVAKKGVTILSQGTLTVVGGEYTTMGGQMFRIEGKADISGATITCPQEAVSAANGWYDSLPIISVHGVNGKLTMTSGTINADVGNTGADGKKYNCGMYGIYVLEGAEVILGEAGADNKALTVNSMFPAIAMNGLTAPGRITVNSGTYNSSVSCTAANETKFNSVIYLPSTANVTINGGVFTATATNDDAHVISIPYDRVGVSSVRVNLNIKGGTFTSQGTVFNHPFAGTTTKARIAISGGTFSSDLGTELANKGIADGYQVYEQEGEAGKKSYTVSASSIVTVNGVPFNDFQQAIAAAKKGSMDAEKTITLGKSLELINESYDLTGVIVDMAGNMFTIPADKTVTLTGGTVRNGQYAEFSADADEITNSRTMFQVDGNLTINGGTYETKGSHLMSVSGTAVIGGKASLSCTAESEKIAALGNYDGSSLLSVTGADGKLTVKDATINAAVGNAANTDGMYGIYVYYGAELVSGEGEDVPTITSTLAAIGMNGLTAPGTITINGGTYTSNASVTSESLKNFNAVIYLPASANVTINGGEFIAAGTAGERHVISVPYNMVNSKHVKLNLIINDGTFTVNTSDTAAQGAIFFDDGMKDQDGEKTANLISVRGGTFNNFEPAYVAGCHEVTNAGKVWTVAKEENNKHTLTWVAMQEATCWDEGVIGHYECLNCHKMYNKKTDDKKELFAADVAIPREEHVGNGKVHEAKDPTCTKAGNKYYVQCENCGLCYESQDALDKDTKGEVGVSESKMILPATGHTYPMEGEEENQTFVIDIDSKDMDYNHFVEGQANGVVVTRTCSVCDASQDEDVKAGAVQNAVVSVAADVNNPEINCQEARTLNYTATATFDRFTADKDGNLTVTDGTDVVTKSFTVTTKVVPHTYNIADVTFNWDNFDIAKFVSGEANGVTATGACSVCGDNSVTPKVTVTSTDYPASGSLDCKMKYHFVATATFGEGEGAPSVRTEPKELPGVHTLTWKQDYKAPTCLEAGQWGALECGVCHELFLGEDSAKAGESVAEADLVIPKRDHALQLKGFSWTNSDQTAAKATFYCTSCKKTVDVSVDSENIVFNEDKSQTASCGVEVDWVYDVSVDFEKTAVTVGTDGKFVYTPTTDGKKINYPGTLTKKVLQPHSFVKKGVDGQPDTANVELVWMDDKTADAGTKHDVSQGVKAVITCENCQRHVAVASKGGIIDDDTTIPDETLVIPYVGVALNETESAKTKATCVAEGTAVYDVNISYDNGAGMVALAAKQISTATPVDENAHAWTELEWKGWVEEVPAQTVDGVRIPPVYSVEASRYCTNPGCKAYPGTPQTDEKGEDVTDEDGNPVLQVQTFKTVTEVPEDKNAPYILVDTEVEQKKTCIRSGITNYVATAYFNAEAVKNSTGAEDHPTPAVYNDPVEGHKIELKWTWVEQHQDSSDDTSPVTKLTGLTVERFCPNCSDSEDPDIVGKPWVVPHDTYTVEDIADNATEENPSVDPEGKLSVYKTGEDATCEKSGSSKYTASLAYTQTDVYENTRVLVNAALGHNMKWHINWTHDPEKGEGSEHWVATAVKQCTRDNVIEVAEAPLTVIYDGSKTPTCLAEGEEVWTITNLPSDIDTEYADNTKKEQRKTLSVDDNAHDYDTATVTAATETQVITVGEVEKEVLPVTFTRVCKREGSDESHTASVTLNATTTEKPVDCSKGYTLHFTLDTNEVKALTDAGWVLPDDYTGTFDYTVAEASGKTNHDLFRVAGGSSDDCSAEIHPTYYECKRCGKRYTTQSALTEYTGPLKGEGVPQGHLYGAPKFTWIEEGKSVQATFTCTRTGCPGTVTVDGKESPKELTLLAALDDEPYVDTPAKCIGMKDEQGNPTGAGVAYGLANLTITESNAQGNLKAGDYFEAELQMAIAPGPHVFENGVCKWCGEEEKARVVFKSYSGEELSSAYYASDASEASITVPTAPNRYGYDFVGWKLNGGTVYGSDAIAAQIVGLLGNKGEIVLTAEYKPVEVSQVDVTVTNIYRAEGSEDVTGTTKKEAVNVGTRYTATSVKDTGYDDYSFSYWEVNGEVAGMNASYEILVQSAVTIHAVYTLGGQAEVKPVVTITEAYGSQVDGSYKLSFASNMSIPEGYEFVESGFVYCNAANGIAEADLNLKNAEENLKNVRKKSLGGTKTNLFSLNLGTDTDGSRRNTKVYAKAYLKCSKNGQIEEFYSNMWVKSYNDVAPTAK